MPRTQRLVLVLAVPILVCLLTYVGYTDHAAPLRSRGWEVATRVDKQRKAVFGSLGIGTLPEVEAIVEQDKATPESKHGKNPGLTAEQQQRQDSLMHYSDDNGRVSFATSGQGANMPEHPVRTLIRRAKDQWQAKLARQSKTLAEAVEQYEQRYGRLPPRGFEKWYAFAKKNGVILIDEYDRIYSDIEPFFALHAKTIRYRTDELRRNIPKHTSSITIDPSLPRGERVICDPPRKRSLEAFAALDEYADILPGKVQFTESTSDVGYGSISYEHREYLVRLARNDFFIAREEQDGFRNVASDPAKPVLDLCAGGSPLYSAVDQEWFQAESPAQTGMPPFSSLIFDHAKSMDVCQAPSLYWMHPQIARVPLIGRLEPMFSWSRSALRSDIGLVPHEQYTLGAYPDEPSFEQKTDGTAVWRGSLTGALFSNQSPKARRSWLSSPRYRLWKAAQDKRGQRNMLIETPEGTVSVSAPLKQISERLVDVAVVGKPIQCDVDVCEELKKTVNFAPFVPLTTSLKHRYIIDIDGNGWSGRFYRLMSSNSVVLKATIFREWYTERIMPWLHYVPLNPDFSDLYDIMAFLQLNPDLSAELARDGKQWAQDHWRLVDMQAYTLRLMLEWARLTNRSEDDMWDFEMPID
ncbi:glycosyltransferase family 90 protein [Mixia osmundae IAM 14324]|uniref:Glycosyl transferase CAP10 domain-containing protein n=1 Tax=Mixia osmundae (strain CBS 9802 / IAM 14324 / JCM 22182 / KY 12970) TaxID=764103 RepID=G7DUM1_MIXOS|nr:glycosyltransferase family 90 protein [Mixia osmundae IAM 14324]KEI36385.1 glycosyltransferase family 90 protein [Mixia osmundae IAM 14324]GAA94281.1 hypothetical protein E5Q_00930 [Mixia osmundae IAM 14324]